MIVETQMLVKEVVEEVTPFLHAGCADEIKVEVNINPDIPSRKTFDHKSKTYQGELVVKVPYTLTLIGHSIPFLSGSEGHWEGNRDVENIVWHIPFYLSAQRRSH